MDIQSESGDSISTAAKDIPTPTSNSGGVSHTIKEELEALGCCPLCVQRYLGVNDSDAYRRAAKQVKNGTGAGGIQADDSTSSMEKVMPSVCVACLGLLQDGLQEEWMTTIVSAVKGKYEGVTTFCLNISMPICIQLRAYSLWYHMQKKFPDFYSLIDAFKPEGVTMKSVWKWVASDGLEDEICPGSVWNSNGLLNIQVNANYDDDIAECSLLFNYLMKHRKGQRRKADLLNRTSLDSVCGKMNHNEFSAIFQSPPAIPTKCLRIKSVDCQHAPIFVAGRYCKFSRTLSQTPWIIDGVRKTETSVEELIVSPIKSFFRPDETRFASSGREDVDVRCLGKGRPFSFELVNPKKTTVSQEQLKQIQVEINISTNDIQIRDLQLVDKKDLQILKDGEESKSKHYGALCCLPEGMSVTQEMLDSLNNYPVPVVLMQKTPVRVLHRRSMSCRKRTIYEIKATSISLAKDNGELHTAIPVPSNLFKLQVKTQAGTYVKEFVHGDLGRTIPNVSEILKIETDIKLLDVESVDVDWPKEIPE